MRLILLALTACGGRSVTSPVVHTDTCVPDTVDVWRIKDAADGLYTVRVDTVDAATTFDPEAFLYTVQSWETGPGGFSADVLLGYQDDSFACTFPPPDYTCPQVLGRAEGITEDLVVLVGKVGGCVSTEAAYELTVVNGTTPVELVYEGNTPVEPFIVAQ